MNRPVQLTVAGQLIRLCTPATAASWTAPPTTGTSCAQDALPLGLDEAPETAPGQGRATAADEERARALVSQVGRVLLEVLQQRRPAGQLGMWMDDDAAAVLLAWRNQRSWTGCTLVGARACVVTPLVVEGSLHLRDPHGDFCAALRLQHGYGRWRVVVFDVLPPAAGVLVRAA